MVQCYDEIVGDDCISWSNDEIVGDDCISWSNVMTRLLGRLYFMVQCYDEIVGDDCISWSNVMTR